MTQQLKSDLKTIKDIFLYLIFGLGWALILYGNDFGGYICFFSWVTILAYHLYIKVQYRLGKSTLVIYIPSLNDDSMKIAAIVIGSMGIAGALVSYFAFHASLIIFLMILLAGFLIFLNGYFDLPGRWIKIEKDSLRIGGIEEIVSVNQLREVVLNNNKIIFHNNSGPDHICTLLKLDNTTVQRVKEFLARLPNTDLKIIDHVGNF